MPWFKANIIYEAASHNEYYKRQVTAGQDWMRFLADAMARSAASINASRPAANAVKQGELTIRDSGQQADDPGPEWVRI